MTDLAALQTWILDAIRFPASPRAPGPLGTTGRVPPSDGLAIYQRGYFLRLAHCMREQFPALCHALGTALFDDFVGEYIRDLPPVSHTLYDLGRRFADFLETTRPDADAPEVWVDFMIDLARYERQLFVLFDAPGHEGQRFATWDTPDTDLRLQPCFALGAYRFPVADYYHAVRRKTDPALPPATPSHIALVRVDYLTRTVPITEPHHVFLAALQRNRTVVTAIETAAHHLGVSVDQAWQSWRAPDGIRRRWIDAGFFIPASG